MGSGLNGLGVCQVSVGGVGMSHNGGNLNHDEQNSSEQIMQGAIIHNHYQKYPSSGANAEALPSIQSGSILGTNHLQQQ